MSAAYIIIMTETTFTSSKNLIHVAVVEGVAQNQINQELRFYFIYFIYTFILKNKRKGFTIYKYIYIYILHREHKLYRAYNDTL